MAKSHDSRIFGICLYKEMKAIKSSNIFTPREVWNDGQEFSLFSKKKKKKKTETWNFFTSKGMSWTETIATVKSWQTVWSRLHSSSHNSGNNNEISEWVGQKANKTKKTGLGPCKPLIKTSYSCLTGEHLTCERCRTEGDPMISRKTKEVKIPKSIDMTYFQLNSKP